MKRLTSLAVFGCFVFSALAQTVQLVSAPDPSQVPPSGGGGDSWAPIISPDGRYVLFSSTAANLVLSTNGTPIPSHFPASMNVFVRDRTNGTTTLISVNTNGIAGGTGDSVPLDISTNGQFALFQSSASDLVASDTNNASDVFLRDLVHGATLLVSVNTNGVPGNAASYAPSMTPDGRYVAFVSAAADLVTGDTNGIPDVFVRDMLSNSTVLASVGAKSTAAVPTGSSESPDLTPDGHYVAFYSTATNLVPAAPAGGDVYIRDLVGRTTVWASIGARAAAQSALGKSNVVSFNHALSADGQVLSYETSPSASTLGLILRYNLGSGLTEVIYTNAAVNGPNYQDIRSLDMTPDGRYVAFLANSNDASGETTCIMVWDEQAQTLALASGDLTGVVTLSSACDLPVLNPTGRFVAFLSNAAGLVTNSTPGDFHVYVRDLQSGVTTLVDSDTNGIGSTVGIAGRPSMSADGNLIVFDCPDAAIVPNDRNHASDAFVRNLSAGASELLSAHEPTLPALTANGLNHIARSSISLDGRFIAFASEADNLIPNDTNGVRDVFVRDLFNSTNILVSVNTNGIPATGCSTDPAITPDGRYVAFASAASDLVQGDNNNQQDVFVRDLQTGTTTLVSVNSAGTGPGNKDSYAPTVSSDGRYVLFRSRATTLVSTTVSGPENLFLRDLQSTTNYALTFTGASDAVMTADGHFVAFLASSSASGPLTLYVWDSRMASRVYTNNAAGVSRVALSPDGSWVLYWTTGLYATNLLTGTNFLISTSRSASAPGLRFSSDGRFLTYASLGTQAGSPPGYQVYLFDFQTGSNFLVSQSWNGSGAADGDSDSPDISSDGRFIAYRSRADNIVAEDFNGAPDIFLYDVQNQTNTLLSASRFGGVTADNRSLLPLFSGNGRTLLFESWASDLVPQDFNQTLDAFAYYFFYVDITAGGTGPLLSWPFFPGRTYGVQFKNNLQDANWQTLTGSVTNWGNRGYFQDPNVAAQRFYRIVAF